MPSDFAPKLAFMLKALTLSRGRLAADLGVDKSVVGRWVTGAVRPSSHNLARLTALVARSVEGFSSLDWDRDLDGLAVLAGVDPAVVRKSAPLAEALPLRFLDQVVAATSAHGAAYEGFYRSTRPFAAQPGRFIHDHAMVRRDPGGLLRLSMGTGGVFVDGWMMPLHNQVFVVGSELTSGSLVFGVFHVAPSPKVLVVDGLVLSSILDTGRTPTATAAVFERIGDLTGDAALDQGRFETLAATDPVAPEGSIPADLRAHLLRDIGPQHLAMGGDLLLRMPVERSWAL